MSEHVSANAGKKTVHNSPDDDPDMDVIISKMPKVGRRNSDGVLVLPKEYYDPADDIYDESC
ncbi:MAG: hypothetical protein FWH44_05500 [Methanomassiliicoccaceae archaeon]|nr:hypothetical protein [Methanomassiliicoccaceae archaeon]